VAVTAPVIAAIQTAQQMGRAAGQTSDGRMKVLAGATTALAGKNAADAVASDPKSGGGVSISITVGGSKSQSKTTQDTSTAAGSKVAAGGNVSIQATGAGQDSTLTVQGSDIKGGGDVSLKADGDINLLAARNASEMHRSSSSVSGGVGVAVSLNSNGAAFGVTANASASRGKGEGSDVSWTNTHVSAGNTLTLESGGNTNLKGAVAAGKQVIANVGGDLNIESLQDTSKYHSKDQSISGSVTVGYGFSGSASASQQKIDSDFASVTEQSGIKAGDKGFQVNVRGNTDLKGAVIASTDKAVQDGVNSLTTATLTQSEIHNRAEYSASSIGIGGGYSYGGGGMMPVGGGSGGGGNTTAGGVGTNQQGQATTGGDKVPGSNVPTSGNWSATPPIVMGASGSGSSVTGSGISGGAIHITDGAKQQALTGKDAEQTVASVNRGVSSERDSSNALKPIFNEQEIKAGFEIVGALQRETGTFLSNRAKESTDAQKELDKERAKPEDQRDAAKIAQLTQVLKDNATWEVGGTGRNIVTALAVAAGANVTGGTAGMLQSAAVNYLQGLGAQQVKEISDSLQSEPARVALHGILACAGAAAQSQSCGAGASGAAASVVLNNLLDGLSGKEAGSLTPEEKEARSNLVSSLVAGIATAAGGDAAVASAAAKIETENNAAFVPIVMGALWLIDKGITAYDAWQDVRAVRDGKKTLEQVAEEKGEEYVTAVIIGNLGKYGIKAVKYGGKWISGHSDEIVKAEKEALERIGHNANGPDLTGKQAGTVLAKQQQKRFDEVTDLFDKSKPNDTLTIGGKKIQATPAGSQGGSNLNGSTKVFDSKNLTDQQIRDYAQQLAGDVPLVQKAPNVWLADLGGGQTITLRSVSSSQAATGARWTIDLRGSAQLQQINSAIKQFELKFR